jgi:hypothetical protein
VVLHKGARVEEITRHLESVFSLDDDHLCHGTSGPTLNPFRYKGKLGYYLDAADTQAVYLRARYFSSARGNFYSRDPLFRANLWEVSGGWSTPDSDQDLVAGAAGIMQSYNVLHSCHARVFAKIAMPK